MIISERKLRFLIKQQLLSENGLTIGNVIGDFINDMQTAQSPDTAKKAIQKNGIIIQIIFALLDSTENLKEMFGNFYNRNFQKQMNSNEKKFLESQQQKREDDRKKIANKLKKFIDKINNVYNMSTLVNGREKKEEQFKDAYIGFKNDLDKYIPQWAPLQFLFYNINEASFLNYLGELVDNNDRKFQAVSNIFWILKPEFEKEISDSVIKYIEEKAKFEVKQINEILADTLDQAKDFSSEEDGNILAGVMDSAYNFLFQGSEFNMAGYGGISQKITGGLKDINKQFGLGDKIENILTSSWEELQKDDGAGLKALMAPGTPLGKFIEGVLNQQTSKMSSKEFGEAIEQILSIQEPLKSGMPDKKNPNVSRSGQKVYKSFEFKK